MDSRDDLLKQYDQLTYDLNNCHEGLKQLKSHSLALLTREKDYYDTEASRRKIPSVITRGIAWLFGVLALFVIALIPLKTSDESNSILNSILGSFPDSDSALLFAVIFGLISGTVVVLDQTFQWTSGFARFRLTQYQLLQQQALYLRDFNAALVAADPTAETTFDALKLRGYELIGEVFNILVAETTTWGSNTETALNNITTNLASIRSQYVASGTTADFAKSIQTAREEKATKAAETKKVGGLVVKISEQESISGLIVEVLNSEKNVIEKKENLNPGERIAVTLPLGLYVLRLLDQSGSSESKEIDSDVVRLVDNKNEYVTLGSPVAEKED